METHEILKNCHVRLTAKIQSSILLHKTGRGLAYDTTPTSEAEYEVIWIDHDSDTTNWDSNANTRVIFKSLKQIYFNKSY